ncbi:MAG: PHB depolymerase family esterase [Longimicrobiales bacterium]|nr:PHB depolymerase family esterase [Longimicrobiales bacterium]
MLRRILLVVLLGLLYLPSSGRAQDPASPDSRSESPGLLPAHRTGQFSAVLPVRSLRSERESWIQRFRFPGDLEGWDYDLAAESFSLYVPPDYDPEGEPYGVVVWISPFDDGGIPPGLREVFDRRRLIWIGANNAGNSRHLFHRSGLALDAAENMERSYHVDPDRIFVSGLSGGGRVATMSAVDFPDVFAGGFPVLGVTTHLDVPLESNPEERVLQFPEPSPDILEQARNQPLVIMTGSEDFNREECRVAAEAYEADGFTRVHLLDIEGMGHEMPSSDDFDRGLELLLLEGP